VRLALVVFFLVVPVAAEDDSVGRPFWVGTPPGARDALRAARKAVRSKQPERAAKALQVVFDRFANAFVADRGGGGYSGARQRATAMLAALGTDMRQTYERLYGGTAEEHLRQALASDDEQGLRAVIRRFEATQAGLGAIVALADRALQRGHPAEARLLLARITHLHPDALARNVPGAEALRARMRIAARRDHAAGGPAAPDPEGLAGEGDVAATEDDEQSHARLDWPMMGGDATRTRIAAAIRKRAGARVAEPEAESAFDIDLAIGERYSDEPIQPDRGFGSRRGAEAATRWRSAWHDYTPLAPVIARGRLVYMDGKQVVATNLYTGDVLWRWPKDPFPETKGRTNISQIFSPAVVDGTVYATVEVSVAWRPQHLQTVPITYYLPHRRLVALDLDTGALRWSHRETELRQRTVRTGIAAAPELSRLSVVGVPLVRGDRIYAPAAYTEGTIHTHLMAIDRHTGDLVYATRISNGQQELNLFGRQLNELVTTPVAESDGLILFGTNLGLVCALDAVLGSPLWVRPYRIRTIPSTYLWFEAPRRWPELDNGPPLIVGDRVILAPADGRGVLCIQRSSGRIVWEFAARHNPLNFPVRRIHGTDGERVFLGGDYGVLALWVRDGAEGGRRGGERAWSFDFDGEPRGAGRGVLAEDGLWVPTYPSILRLDPETGAELPGSFVREGADADRRVQLFAGDGAIVTAGRDFIAVRYVREDVLRLATEAIRRNPAAAAPRLSAADIHLAVDAFAEAIRSYRDALERAERAGEAALAERARIGLHRALLQRAMRLLDEDPVRARTAFDAAFRAAPDTAREWEARRGLELRLATRRLARDADWRLQNLRRIEKKFGDRALDSTAAGRSAATGRTARGWALRRMARIHVARGDPRRAVADLQTLLERNPQGADAIAASDDIAEILQAAGRKVYETYERRARDLYKATLSSGNLDALERGLRIYANSLAASDATLRLATRRLDNGDPARASALLQRFLVDRPNDPRTPEALRLLFRSFHTRKAHGPAYGALQRLRRSHPRARLTRDDGATVLASTWADRWFAREPYATLRRSAHRRDLEPPLVERFDVTFPGNIVDVPDLLGQRHPALRNAVLVRLGRQAAALDAANGTTIYRLNFGRRPPIGPFVLAGGHLLATTSERVHVFDAGTGRVVARQPIPAGNEGIRLVEQNGQVFLLSRGRQRGSLRVTALDPEMGTPLWSRSIPRRDKYEQHSERFVVAQADRLVLFSTGTAYITVLDTSSGAIENRIAVHEEGTAYLPSAPHALPDGRILAGYVATTGPRRSRSGRTYMLALIDPGQPGREAIIWKSVPGRGVRARRLDHVQVIGDHVLAVESGGDDRIAVIRLHDGHLVRERPLEDLLGEPVVLAKSQPRSDSLLLLLTAGSDGQPPRLFALEPPDLTLKYALEMATASNVRPGVVRSDGVITISLEPKRLKRGGLLQFQLVDALNARRVQTIEPRVGDGNWFTAKVQNGYLLVTLANRVIAYGPK